MLRGLRGQRSQDNCTIVLDISQDSISPSHQVEEVILISSDSPDKNINEAEPINLCTSVSAESVESTLNMGTPTLVVGRTTTNSFTEPHVSWDVVSSQKQGVCSRMESVSSRSSSFPDQSTDTCTTNKENPTPSRDPETDLLAKFASFHDSFKLAPSSCPVNSHDSPLVNPKLRRTGSVATILKTPTKNTRDRTIQLYSPGSIKRSVSATADIKEQTLRMEGINSFPDIKPISLKRSLIRHATSPAALNSQKIKVARLLNLAEKISSPRAEIKNTNHDTIEDPPSLEEVPRLCSVPPSQKRTLTPITPHKHKIEHLFDSVSNSENFDGLSSSNESVGKVLQNSALEEAAGEQNQMNDINEFNVEDFFDSDFSSDIDESLLEEADRFYEDNAASLTPTQPTEEPEEMPLPSDDTCISKFHRYTVSQVSKYFYDNLEEVHLKTSDNPDFTIILRDHWLDSVPPVKSVINFIGEVKGTTAVIDNEQNLLVVEPDTLISCTSVSESFFCKRKIILGNTLRGPGDTNIPMVYGSMIHEVFQFCLAANEFSLDFINEKIAALVETFYEQLYLCDVSTETAVAYLQGKVAKICEWGDQFISPTPHPLAFVDEHRSRSRHIMSISKIIDIEEEIWSSMYGLKGKIDVTVETCLQDASRQYKYLAPLEIKTSANTRAVGHRAQTSLYVLLLSDRYGIDIKHGILVYSETGETIRIPKIASEIRDLIIQRNQLALGMYDKSKLPMMINNERMCGMCGLLDPCMIFQRVANQYHETYLPGVFDEYFDIVEHLMPDQIEFFKYWNESLSKEEQSVKSHLKELWTMTSQAREAVGRCFARVKVQGEPEELLFSEVTSRYTYMLVRSDETDSPFKESDDLSEGDPIIVSDESGHIFLASGFLSKVNELVITIKVDRRLTDSLQKQIGFNETDNQAYHSLMHSTWEETNTQSISTIFRIDKNEFAMSMSLARNNLVELMLMNNSYSQLETIVDLQPPRFDSLLHKLTAHSYWNRLNPDQISAVQKILAANDYAVISGMPGTGKTVTLAATIIHLVVDQKKTVLIASYTHSAVDDLLRKVKDLSTDVDKFGILRLGQTGRIHPEIQEFAADKANASNYEELDDLYMSRPLVATTCLGISHWMFNRRRFDYCIIDDASHASMATCLGPLRFANKFILVGSLGAIKLERESTLVDRLSQNHPQAVTTLTYQYRMCNDIMELSNRLGYNWGLKCGSKDVAERTLKIPYKNVVVDGWLGRVLQER